jgi:hypothetical protein
LHLCGQAKGDNELSAQVCMLLRDAARVLCHEATGREEGSTPAFVSVMWWGEEETEEEAVGRKKGLLDEAEAMAKRAWATGKKLMLPEDQVRCTRYMWSFGWESSQGVGMQAGVWSRTIGSCASCTRTKNSR